MKEATAKVLKTYDALWESRKAEILNTTDNLIVQGTTYYVSCSGDDNNDGLSPETPWKTDQRINSTCLHSGDAILFKRDDVFRGYQVTPQAGISYGAYGSGEKPKFYGHYENLANSALWEKYDSEHHIWKYTKKIANPGTLVLNDGEFVAHNLIPSFRDHRYVCRYDEEKPFVIENELKNHLDFFWHFEDPLSSSESKGENFPIPDVGAPEKPLTHTGDLYLKCDYGNPGKFFSSIEAIAYLIAFNVSDTPNVTIDNLCIKYYCFAVAGGGTTGLRVSNCEIGWIGGNIQNFSGLDPNYPEGRRGSVTRYGNGIEIYGSCHNYIVSNCYIYQSYDAGASHQACIARKITMTSVQYTNNLIENCVYGIEYFLDSCGKDVGSYMDDIIIRDNIIRFSGYGWGQQRHNVDTPALIKGWSYENPASNFYIENNIFDRSAYRMLHLVAREESSCPELNNNTYIQKFGGMIGQYGANKTKEPDIEFFNKTAEDKIHNILGDKNAEVFFIE